MAEEKYVSESDTTRPKATAWALQPLPAMSDREFARWKGLVEKRTGLSVTEDRRHHLQTSIGLRMREIGETSYGEYYERIVSGPGGMAEWANLLDRITIQETRFFRDPDAFALVEEHLRRLLDSPLKGSVEVWSVGCSTGEEPYSLAIVISEVLRDMGRPGFFGVTGTDISKSALDTARRGSYPERKLVNVSPEMRERHFRPEKEGRHFQVSAEIRERTCFARLNIAELERAPKQMMHVIYCQNMLIYFRRWRRKAILDELARRLAPGGLLVLGMGEITGWSNPLLDRVPNERCLAYRRRMD